MGADITKGSVFPLSLVDPTATHSQLVTQETAMVCVWALPGAPFGVGVNDHDDPFQASARGTKIPIVGTRVSPTAVHVVALKHATPSSSSGSLDALALGMMAHA